jgi:L-rhamnose mutarotase
MFCLSKCKEILQGVKYSTFSILASLLGNNKIRNYSKYINTDDVCLIHSWSSVIEINNNKLFDIELHKKITNNTINIQTNINKIFI